MLDEGCIELMHSGHTSQTGYYIVQIIDLKPIKNPQSGAADRYRLVISDGRHYMHVRAMSVAPRQRCTRRR